MDNNLRADFRKKVILAMADRKWSQARTAKEAGIAENTVAKVVAGEVVTETVIGKLMKTLEIPSLVENHFEAALSAKTRLVHQVVDVVMNEMTDAEQDEFIGYLLPLIATRPNAINPDRS